VLLVFVRGVYYSSDFDDVLLCLDANLNNYENCFSISVNTADIGFFEAD